MQYIDINKDLIPYRFRMRLGGETWEFEVRYNKEYDFFTIDLFKDDEAIITGEKIVYSRPLFNSYVGHKPAVNIIPFDQSGNASRAGWGELGKSVFLYLIEGEDDE